MTGALDNINFQILLKQHGGNMDRALAAWRKILSLGGFGDVPHEYAGGLDLQSLRVLADERSQKQTQAVVDNVHFQRRGETLSTRFTPIPNAADDLEDRIKQIEDIASGDDPKD